MVVWTALAFDERMSLPRQTTSLSKKNQLFLACVLREYSVLFI